ncbi:hypothetical protein [Xylophilus sp.]|uniref:hypothetical protein n=1 Tax=Xylophilus sp. TaxID=2653893 RepID=UPI0013B707B9|nr:hypothetical protein [Xylophilus sp.]KAF1045618.1 MAG: hypothetical protein GAK38_02910 [Xylophilus sp.]
MTDAKKKANGSSWAKGRSGNPGGRSPRVGPNGETLAQLAREHTADALATLVAVCNGEVGKPDKDNPKLTIIEAKDRISAANAILDRGWGKPKESVDIDANVKGTGLPVINLTVTRSDHGGA